MKFEPSAHLPVSKLFTAFIGLQRLQNDGRLFEALVYCKRPPRELEKVVVTTGRLQEYTLVRDQKLKQ